MFYVCVCGGGVSPRAPNKLGPPLIVMYQTVHLYVHLCIHLNVRAPVYWYSINLIHQCFRLGWPQTLKVTQVQLGSEMDFFLEPQETWLLCKSLEKHIRKTNKHWHTPWQFYHQYLTRSENGTAWSNCACTPKSLHQTNTPFGVNEKVSSWMRVWAKHSGSKDTAL